ncbi:methionine aminopeptidase, type I [Chitinophaga costaii]|uniref:Methionine aminopeptidase n=1 Tax=Chitinophaga costaii TaxID=1335309 RepID=A0A1C3ZU42_9BACT|nr:type I methionyl aminopeptidase [Chitinophaga costaii]PUZ30499.1 type I methionyl aminopeptidase [Chitinophaga costaii]SCB85782.1 methionine aminopeptidase, type I [Chitinophaga costaii]
MIHYKTKEEIEIMRKSALLVSAALAAVAKELKPGMTTEQVDTLAGQFIRDNGAIPSFLNYKGFPKNTCISVNEAVVHGIPGAYVIKEGDVVSVDVGVFLNGYHGDSAYTFAVGQTPENILKLLAATKASLYKGIEKAVVGNRIGDIAYAIQEYTEKERGYGVVRELVGHGLGQHLHEDPQVPNYGKRGSGPVMKEGLVIAIEPMINLGKKDVEYNEDGWTVVTRDGKASAHFEHNVAVTKGKADILSSFAEIEAAEHANPALSVLN